MSGFIIRIVGMITMLADHIGWNFIDNLILLTRIGRIAFPCGGYVSSTLILSLSNCKLGYHKKWFKWLYTLFYPVHALIIGIIIVLLG